PLQAGNHYPLAPPCPRPLLRLSSARPSLPVLLRPRVQPAGRAMVPLLWCRIPPPRAAEGWADWSLPPISVSVAMRPAVCRSAASRPAVSRPVMSQAGRQVLLPALRLRQTDRRSPDLPRLLGRWPCPVVRRCLVRSLCSLAPYRLATQRQH